MNEKARCIPYSIRLLVNDVPSYCDIDGQIKKQMTKDSNGEWAKCQNNYECESNLCSSGECIELKDVVAQANGIKTFFVKIICGVSNIFNSDGYNQCIYDNLGSGVTSSTTPSSGGGGGAGGGSVPPVPA